MTPDSYIARLGALLAAEQYQQAIDFSEAAWPDIEPALTLEERERVYSIMEVVATIVSLDEAAASSPATLTTPADRGSD
jgi:hypothetical protein